MNRRIIALNIAEAREQLEKLERWLTDKAPLSEGHLQVMVEHAYHHVNVAWNARRETIARYRQMADKDFNAWGRFPKDIELPKLPPDVPQRRPSNSALQPTRAAGPKGQREPTGSGPRG